MAVALWRLCAGDLRVCRDAPNLGLADPRTAATHHLQVMLAAPILLGAFTMIKDSPNPPLNSAPLHADAHRAINSNPTRSAESTLSADGLFTVRTDLDAETLLANASQDLTSVQVLAANLAFEVDGAARDVALGICRMLEGIQLLVDRTLDQFETQNPMAKL
jgi:hypothetical protein